MKRLLAAALICFAPGGAHAQDNFVVIVNQANTVGTLRPAELSKIFLRKRTTWPDGQRIEPVDQAVSSPIRRIFSDAVHGMDVASVKSYWQRIVFSGRGEPPPERTSDADVIAFVRGHANGIGYVSAAAPVDGVRVIALAAVPE
jgi:ABC-type phosphate transport system substrate-binding protein